MTKLRVVRSDLYPRTGPVYKLGQRAAYVLMYLFVAALGIGLGAITARGQTVQATPVSPALPKACWPQRMLTGKDTAWLQVPCRSMEVLAPAFRAKLDSCLFVRLRRGQWEWLISETGRSDARQQELYKSGRTKPGLRVTNAYSVVTTVHGYGMAVDIVSKPHGWTDPKFFRWLMIHAEACGLVAGGAWKKFPDAPHIQIFWQGSPPLWARAWQADSLPAIWRTIGVHQ